MERFTHLFAVGGRSQPSGNAQGLTRAASPAKVESAKSGGLGGKRAPNRVELIVFNCLDVGVDAAHGGKSPQHSVAVSIHCS